MTTSRTNASWRFFLSRTVPFIGGSALAVYGLSALSVSSVSTADESTSNTVKLSDQSTWPVVIYVTAHQLTRYETAVSSVKIPINQPTPLKVGDRSFLVKLSFDTVEKSAQFGTPLYRLDIFNEDGSQLLDYMFNSLNATATFPRLDLQFYLKGCITTSCHDALENFHLGKG